MIREFSLIIVWANLIIIASCSNNTNDNVKANYEADNENDASTDVSTETVSPTSASEKSPKEQESLQIEQTRSVYQEKITQDNRASFVFEHNLVRSSTEPKATDMVFMVNLRLSSYQ